MDFLLYQKGTSITVSTLKTAAMIRIFLIIPTLFLFTLLSLVTLRAYSHNPQAMNYILYLWSLMAFLYLCTNLIIGALPAEKISIIKGLTYFSILMELTTNQLIIYALGSLISYVVLFIIVIVAIYRVFLNYEFSLFSALTGMCLFTSIALLELGGILPLAPGLPDPLEHSMYLKDNIFLPIRAIAGILMGIGIAFISINYGMNQNQKLQNTLRVLSMKDGLTGIANRRSFEEYLQREWKRARRHETSISLILIDIDCFKKYNDHFGHLKGDDCLKWVAQTLERDILRPGDTVARYGGEEFIVILPETPLKAALTVAERLRKSIVNLQLEAPPEAPNTFVTISLGVAETIPDHESPSRLLKEADAALYRAKTEGRNRVATTGKTSV